MKILMMPGFLVNGRALFPQESCRKAGIAHEHNQIKEKVTKAISGIYLHINEARFSVRDELTFAVKRQFFNCRK